MFIATHVGVGALIATQLPQQPAAVLALSFVSHFLIDAIPHGDTHMYNGYVSGERAKRAALYVGTDIVVSIALVVYLVARGVLVDHPIALVAGIAGSVVPDVLIATYEVSKHRWLKGFHRFHFACHNAISGRIGDLSIPTGIALDVGLLVVALLLIVR